MFPRHGGPRVSIVFRFIAPLVRPRLPAGVPILVSSLSRSLPATLLYLALLPTLALPAATTRASDSSVVVHVAVDGDDADVGGHAAADGSTEFGPLASLEAARDVVHKLLAAEEPSPSITVLLHGGTHRLAAPLEFTAADSGTPETAVTWQAACGWSVATGPG